MENKMNATEIVELDLFAEELPERLNALAIDSGDLAASTLGTASCYGTFGTATGTAGTFGSVSSVSSLS